MLPKTPRGSFSDIVLGQSGLVAQLTKRVVERALAGELTHHLGYAKGEEPPGENCRNGSSAKRVWFCSFHGVWNGFGGLLRYSKSSLDLVLTTF